MRHDYGPEHRGSAVVAVLTVGIAFGVIALAVIVAGSFIWNAVVR